MKTENGCKVAFQEGSNQQGQRWPTEAKSVNIASAAGKATAASMNPMQLFQICLGVSESLAKRSSLI